MGFRDDSFYKWSKPILAMPGDDLSIDDISVIKIDVEGSELEVLQGLIETIDKFSPFILFEVLSLYNPYTRK